MTLHHHLLQNHSIAHAARLMALVFAAGCASIAPGNAAERPSLAIAAFDFKDTSGEPQDQSSEHRARLEEVTATLRRGLADSEKVKPLALDCQVDGCSARVSGLEALSAEAMSAGAKYLLVGEVHKMSTLVGWMKFAVLDLAQRKPTCDRFLTYRGDTDEAWRRAAEFVVQQVEQHCMP